MSARILLFVGAFCYLALFRHYGLQLEDEGLLLLRLDRILRGEIPYLDFHTGYAPGYFYLTALMFKTGGSTAGGLRLMFSAVHALSAVAGYSLIRGFARPALAASLIAGWIGFLPVFAGEFASFNVPYPAWLVVPIWILVAICMQRYASSEKMSVVLWAGVLSAVAFAIKPNAGAYCAVAAVLSLGQLAPCRSRGERLLLLGVNALAMAVALIGFAQAWHLRDALFYLLPLIPLAAKIFRNGFDPRAAPEGPTFVQLFIRYSIGFAVPTLAWVLPFLWMLGPADFVKDVLMIGSSAAAVYYRPLPLPEPHALLLLLAALGYAGGGYLVKTRGLRPLPLLLAGLALALSAGMAIYRAGLLPESFARSVTLQLENASFWLGLLALWAGLLVVTRGSANSRVDRGLTAVYPFALAMWWQLYPRSDFMHLIASVPLVIVVAAALLERVLEWWRAGGFPRAFEPAALTTQAVILGAALLSVLPSVATAWPCLSGAQEASLVTRRATICLEAGASDDLHALMQTVEYVGRHSDASEKTFAFPALGAALFFAERASAVPRDYWFPGRPDHDDEARILTRLRETPPRLIVTLNDGWSFFAAAPAYYAKTRHMVLAEYRLAARFGRYDVLEPASDGPARSVPVSVAVPPTASLPDLVQPNMAHRRQAARRWVAHLEPRAARAAALPRSRRDALLVLRAIRDGGDMRAAAWLAAGYHSKDLRLRRESASAMAKVAERFSASRFRWAGDFDPAGYRGYVAPLADTLGAMEADGNPRVRRFASLVALIRGGDA